MPEDRLPSPVQVVLVGPPGAGKSTVGAVLARQLGRALRDTDSDVESAEGRSIADIFIEDGEPRFRALEEQAVVTALGEHDGVLALGGGAILSAATRRSLADVPVVFLDVSLAKAMPRVGLSGARPLLVESPRARWRILMEERRPLYEEVADLRLDTDEHTPEQLAAILVAAVERGEVRETDA